VPAKKICLHDDYSASEEKISAESLNNYAANIACSGNCNRKSVCFEGQRKSECSFHPKDKVLWESQIQYLSAMHIETQQESHVSNVFPPRGSDFNVKNKEPAPAFAPSKELSSTQMIPHPARPATTVHLIEPAPPVVDLTSTKKIPHPSTPAQISTFLSSSLNEKQDVNTDCNLDINESDGFFTGVTNKTGYCNINFFRIKISGLDI
jgi:hypothetical protein